jgi:hypothetical protein
MCPAIAGGGSDLFGNACQGDGRRGSAARMVG